MHLAQTCKIHMLTRELPFAGVLCNNLILECQSKELPAVLESHRDAPSTSQYHMISYLLSNSSLARSLSLSTNKTHFISASKKLRFVWKSKLRVTLHVTIREITYERKIQEKNWILQNLADIKTFFKRLVKKISLFSSTMEI